MLRKCKILIIFIILICLYILPCFANLFDLEKINEDEIISISNNNELKQLLNRKEHCGLYYNTSTGYIVDAISKNIFVIPKEIEDNKIVGIAKDAFALSYDIENIYIPDTVTDISDNAFGQFSPVIKCFSDSYAEQYAIEHNMEYEIITEDEYDEELQEQEENIEENSNSEENNSFSDMQKIEDVLIDFINGIRQGSIEENIAQLDLEDNYDFKFYSSDGEELDEDEPIATGMKIVIYDEEGNVLKEHTIILYGDTDGDGKITKEDAKKIIQNKLKKQQFEEECYEQAGNILSENTPTAIDALAIIKAEQGDYEIKQSKEE